MQIPSLRVRVACIVGIAAFLTWMFHQNRIDDALIYARYVRNALQGYGLVFNPGEHVNALTSPLYSAAALLVSWLLRGNVLLAEDVLWVIFLSAAASLAERLAPWSGLVIVSSAYFYYCLGMETALFLFMLMLLATLYLEVRDTWIPLVALLVALTRLEGAALVLVVAIQMVRERRFPPLRSFLLPTVVVCGYLFFNFRYYGGVLPSSGLAKLAQARSEYWGRWPTGFLRLPAILYYAFKFTIYLAPLVFILAPMGVWKAGTKLNQILIPFVAILGLFYVLCNLPNFHWYYAPFIFFGILYAALGMPQSKTTSALAAVVVLQCLAVSAYKGSQTPVDYPYKQLGLWLEQNTAKDAKIAAMETGAIGWFSNRYIDDIVGLTTPVNAVYLVHHDLYSWLNQQKPDYVVMHEHPSLGELAAAASPDYEYLPIQYGSILLMRRRQGAP